MGPRSRVGHALLVRLAPPVGARDRAARCCWCGRVSLWRGGSGGSSAAAACVPRSGRPVGRVQHDALRPPGVSLGRLRDHALRPRRVTSTWYGEFTGYWNIQCPIQVLQRHGVDSQGTDQSSARRSSSVTTRSTTSATTRSGSPTWCSPRWGHITGLYKPLQQTSRSTTSGGSQHLGRRPSARRLVHRRSARDRRCARVPPPPLPVFPLLGPPRIVVWIAVTITFATTRYRASAEGALCLLAAVGVDALIAPVRRLTRRSRGRAAGRRARAPRARLGLTSALALRALGNHEEDEGGRVDRLGDRELLRRDRRRL